MLQISNKTLCSELCFQQFMYIGITLSFNPFSSNSLKTNLTAADFPMPGLPVTKMFFPVELLNSGLIQSAR